MTSETYRLEPRVAPMNDYLRLRAVTGLTPRSEAAAYEGLPNSCGGAVIVRGDEIVAMGRLVGDGALFLQIVDIAVDPAHQGRGLGKRIMQSLMEQARMQAPGECYVSLMADGDAQHLYRQFGFEPVAPRSIGMAAWIGRKA